MKFVIQLQKRKQKKFHNIKNYKGHLPMNNKNRDTLEERLGYYFDCKTLLQEALTHKSYHQKPYNERLEFLGDSVVNLIVGEYIFEKFPEYPEGKLSKLRASLVSEESLTKIADNILLGDYILLSVSEERNDGRQKSSILSDTFEAIIGAIFLESGFRRTKEILKRLIDELYQDIKLEDLYSDYKTLLQEYTQAKFGVIPQYNVIAESGPEHNKIFTFSVRINDKEWATSTGKSKKIAQQNCAQKTLALLKLEKDDNE